MMKRFALLLLAFALTSSASIVRGPVAPAGGGGGGWAHVQTNGSSQTSSSSTVALAYTSNVTSGSLLVATVAWGDSTQTISGVADSLGQTWTQVGSTVTGLDELGFWRMAVFYKANSGAGADTVTATFSAATTYRQISVTEYSGILTASPLDQTVGQAQDSPGTGTDAVTSTSVTTGQTNELIYGAAIARSALGSFDSGTGFTSRLGQFDGTYVYLRVEDKNLAAAGSTAATFTVTFATDDTAAIVATFKTP